MNGLRTDRVSIDEFMDLRGFESDKVADQRKGENDMPVTGEWNISIDSPLGAQTATLMLTQDGERLTGTQASERETVTIEDGTIDGDALTWSASVSSPMPMKLAFTGKIADDAISGSVAAGAFGRFPFTGSRGTV